MKGLTFASIYKLYFLITKTFRNKRVLIICRKNELLKGFTPTPYRDILRLGKSLLDILNHKIKQMRNARDIYGAENLQCRDWCRGFSLIELIVAISLFSVAATIGTGALLSVSDAQQKVLALRIVQDNFSYLFDTITKEIRTGTNYHCGISINDFDFYNSPRDCSSPGGPSFTFRNNASEKITYRLNNGRVERIINGNDLAPVVLTSPAANVTNLSFYVVGSPTNDNKQSRVTIILSGTAGIKERIKSHIDVQTTVSQRSLDS